jgi:hypothetical protein
MTAHSTFRPGSQTSALGRLYAHGICPESGRTQQIEEASMRPAFKPLDLGLLRDLQGVIYLDPKVSYGAFDLAMPEQELNGP